MSNQEGEQTLDKELATTRKLQHIPTRSKLVGDLLLHSNMGEEVQFVRGMFGARICTILGSHQKLQFKPWRAERPRRKT
jgi:hypothetical protein